MAIDKSHPMRFTPKGLSDAWDSTDEFPGACQSLQNYVFDQSNPEILIARPGVKRYINFNTAGFTNPGYVSIQQVIGTRIYGLIASGRNSGHDEPFIYEMTTGTFVPTTGITGANTPLSPATTGDWVPPTLANIGTMVIVTHPGYNGTANKFGWWDITNPAAPVWHAGDTATNALTGVPTSVANFFNRAYFAVGNQTQFTDILTNPPTRTNASQALVIGDSVAVNAQSGLPVQTTSSGVVQSLYIFKPSQVWQVTGDSTLSNLSLNFVSLTVGTTMPRSVALATTGLYFMSAAGPYFIDALGSLRALTHSAQQTDPDIQIPFQNAQSPTRWAAAYGSSMYRICGLTVIKGVQTTNDYWFDEHRRRWTGPHSYGYDCVSATGNAFIVSSAYNPGIIGYSQVKPDSTSVYADLDSTYNSALLSCTFPKTGDMAMKQVVESTIELEASLGLTQYTVQAQDEQGNVMGTVVMQVFPGRDWGAFFWGDGTLWEPGITWGSGPLWGTFAEFGSNDIWRSGQQIPSTYPVSWASPLVFDKMQLAVSALASAQVGVGTFYARYQQTGYQVMNSIAIQSIAGTSGSGSGPGPMVPFTGSIIVEQNGAVVSPNATVLNFISPPLQATAVGTIVTIQDTGGGGGGGNFWTLNSYNIVTSDFRSTIAPNQHYDYLGVVATDLQFQGNVVTTGAQQYEGISFRELTSVTSGTGYAACQTFIHNATPGAGSSAYGYIGQVIANAGAGKITHGYDRATIGGTFTGTAVASTIAITNNLGAVPAGGSAACNIDIAGTNNVTPFPIAIFITNNTAAASALNNGIVIDSSVVLGASAFQWNQNPGTTAFFLACFNSGLTPLFRVNNLGNLDFGSTAQFITANWSDATLSNRLTLKTNVTNGVTIVNIIPDGSGTAAGFQCYNASDFSNHSRLAIQARTTGHILNSVNVGAGSVQPIASAINGTVVTQVNTDLSFAVKSGIQHAVTTLTGPASLTLTTNNYLVVCDATAGNVTVTLPLANTAGAGQSPVYRVKRKDSTAGNTVTIGHSGGDTIDGAATFALGAKQSVDLQSDGSTLWNAL